MPRILSGRVIGYLAIMLVLDLTLVPIVRIGMIQPILLYLAILYAAFQWGWEKTVPMAFLVGLMRDLAGAHPFGLEMTVLVATSILLDLAVQKIDRQSIWTRLAMTFLFVFFASLLHLALSSFLGHPLRLSGYALWVALGTALYTTALIPLFFPLAARWFQERAPLKQYELFS